MLDKAKKLLEKLANSNFTGKVIISFSGGNIEGVEEVKKDQSIEYREG